MEGYLGTGDCAWYVSHKSVILNEEEGSAETAFSFGFIAWRRENSHVLDRAMTMLALATPLQID